MGRATGAALGRPVARGVGTTSAANQLLGLPGAAGVGSRVQPMGLLVLRYLDSAPDLTRQQDGRLRIVGRPSSRVNSLERVADRQVLEPADEYRGDVLGFTGEFDRLQPRHKLGEEALDLHPGQRSAETEVHAIAKCIVLVGVTTDIEPERVVEDLFVAVGRRVGQQYRFSSTDRHTANSGVFLCR